MYIIVQCIGHSKKTYDFEYITLQIKVGGQLHTKIYMNIYVKISSYGGTLL